MTRLKTYLTIAWNACFGAACIVSLAGCNRGPAYGDVSGQVTLDGKAVEAGSIRFSPIDGLTASAGAPIAGGSYKAEHVPVNKFRVEISAPKKIDMAHLPPGTDTTGGVVPPELIPDKYNSNSELTIEVKEGGNSKDFPLVSK
jgi:hypothetical protein